MHPMLCRHYRLVRMYATGRTYSNQVKRFFLDYKTLEQKEVVVDEPLGRDAAIETIREALELYRRSIEGKGRRA